MNDRLKSLATQLRGVARDLVSTPTTSEVEWPGGLTITELRPVKPVRGHVINKFNRVVLRGTHAGRPVKLYEACSVEHAIFLETLAHDPRFAKWFPAIVARSGRCLLARWIEGRSPEDDAAIADVIELQAALHAVPAATFPVAGWDFWADYLRPRFIRAADMIGAPIDDLVAQVDEVNARPTRVVVHLDLKPANLITDATGVTLSVDNESCTTSTLPLLDVCHTARALRARGQSYWKSYQNRASPDVTPPTIAALQIAWVARLVGSFFVAGQLTDAAKILRDHRSGKNLLPFDLH